MTEIPQLAARLSSDLEAACTAAALAGEIVKEDYGKPAKVGVKGVGDIVTATDKRADSSIKEFLTAHFPGDARMSEELDPRGHSRRGRCWVVDPLDSTITFSLGTGTKEYPSCMIALQVDGKTQVSVIYFPLTGEWFYAKHGEGAYDGTGRRLSIAPCPLDKAWVDLNAYGDHGLQTDAFCLFRKGLRKEKPEGNLKGSTRKNASLVTTLPPHSGIAARIASGKPPINAVVHDNNPLRVKQAPWDVIPAELILREADGGFWNLTGQPYDPFHPELFVGGHKNLVDEILNIISPSAREKFCSGRSLLSHKK